MKRALLFVLVISLCLPLFLTAKTKFTIAAYGTYMSVTDSSYQALYGRDKFLPEGKVTMTFRGNLYLWGGYGYLPAAHDWTEWSNKGEPEADVAGRRSTKKQIFSGGIGFYVGYIDKLSLNLELGACHISHNIESTWTKINTNKFLSSEENRESGTGFIGNLGLSYGVYKNIYTQFVFSYAYATHTINDTKINLGGLKLSLGLGIKF